MNRGRRALYEVSGREIFWLLPQLNVPEVGPVHDEIDSVLAAHYGFTNEELDFIPSTKLRAGRKLRH